MIDRDPTPIENALDWLNHATYCELEVDENETIRSQIVPEAMKEYRAMQKEIERLKEELAAARTPRAYWGGFGPG